MNKRYGKKIFIFTGCLLAFLAFFSTGSYSCAFEGKTRNIEGKEIYVVYDNSGSMLKKNAISSSPWYETAYAMELLASMLEENDTVYVYFMQDVSVNGEDGYYVKTYQINDDDRKWRMEELHDDLRNITYTSDTDASGLMQAVEDLKQNQSDSEKFLVVLSDGDFNVLNGQPSAGVDYMQKAEDDLENDEVKIIYLTLSEKVENTLENQSNMTVISYAGEESGPETEGNRIFEMFAELGQLIFGRYELEYEVSPKDDGYQKITFRTNLPINSLMVLVQSEQSDVDAEEIKMVQGRLECASKGEISGPTVEDAQNQKNSFIHQLEEEVTGGSYKGVYSVWTGKNDAAESGEYILEVPTDARVNIYAKYDVDYRIIARDENGAEKDITKVNSVLEGEYELEVQLVNKRTGSSVQDNEEIYKNLSVDLEIEDGENVETMTGRRRKVFSWTEGTVYITGEIELDKVGRKKVKEKVQVIHRLGEIRVNIIGLENGLDVDKIDDQKLHLTVWEDGEDISNYIENISVKSPVNGIDTEYQYVCTEENGKWFISPKVRESPYVGEEEIIIEVLISKDGPEQKGSWRERITYSMSEEFGFDITGDQPRDDYLFGVKIFPTFNGKKIYDPEKSEIINLTETLEAEEPWKKYLELQYVNDNPLEYRLCLKNISGIVKFWQMGSMRATVHLEGKRYGQEIKGSKEIERPILPAERVGNILIGLLFLVIAILVIVWIIFRLFRSH